MSKTWLKMIGTTVKPCADSWTDNHVHFRKNKPGGIHPGDHLILYAVGRKKRVFALAEVTSEVYENGQEEWCYQMDVNYIVNLPVKSGVSIDKISTERDLIGPIQWGSSYIELEPKEYDQAVALLRAAFATSANRPNHATLE
jgi:hypothetical protein